MTAEPVHISPGPRSSAHGRGDGYRRIYKVHDKMKRSFGKTAYRILIMALVILMVPVLCGCRQRITNNTEVINTISDEDGWLSENYQARRDELSMPTAEPPLINTGSSEDDDYDEYYDDDDDILSDFDMDDVEDEDKDDKQDNKDKDKDKEQGSAHKPGGGSTKPKIKVTLNANGGKCSTKFVQVEKGGTYAGLPTPTRDGYDFDGWYTDKEKGKEVTAQTKVTDDKAHTLYAHWKKQKAPTVTVTFDPYRSDAEFTSGEETMQVQVGSHYGTLPKVACEGYEFEGWFTEKKEGTKVTSKTRVSETGDHTLYAHWTRKEEPEPEPEPEPVMHTVTFDPNGGDFTSGESTMQLEEDGTYSKLPTVTRDGYTFEGWFTDPEGGERISGGDKFTAKEDITLYAHWQYDPYTTWDNNFKAEANEVSGDVVCYIVGKSTDRKKNLIESCKGKVGEDSEEPGCIVEFIEDFKDLSSEDLETRAAAHYDSFLEAHPEAEVSVILVSDEAIYGSDNQKLWYRLAILQTLHGSLDEDALDQAASDLGVEVYYPYVYKVESGDGN